MSKSPEVTTRAVIIGRMSVGDGSVRVLAYTESHGLLFAIAKSAREERSKLRPHTQVGTYGHYTFVHGAAHGWRLVGAVDTTNTHFARGDHEAQAAVARVLSIVRQLVHGEEVNDALFEALWNFMCSVEDVDAKLARALEHVAVLRIVAALGYVSSDADDGYVGSGGYTEEILTRADNDRTQIVRTINTALAASGLS